MKGGKLSLLIPQDMINDMDMLIKAGRFTNKAEIVKLAVREYLEVEVYTKARSDKEK